MKRWTVFLFLALPAACGVTQNHVIGSYPDGSVAQEIDCRQDHPEKCQQRSQELCHPFGREPRVLNALAYDEGQGRWKMVVTCGPLGAEPSPVAGSPSGAAPAAPAPTGSLTPLPGNAPPTYSGTPQ